jgi:ribose transport system substrate-binding protein
MRGRIVAVGAIAAAVVLAAGCGASSNGGTGASNSSPSSSTNAAAAPSWLTAAQTAANTATQIPSTIADQSLGAFKPKAHGKLYVVDCDLSLEGCSQISNAFGQAAKAIGYSITQCNGGSSATAPAQCFTNAVNAHPSAIIVNGIDAQESGGGFAAAQKAKIPIIGSFTGDTLPTAGVASEVAGTACEQEGKLLGDWVIADSKGKANAMFVGTQTYNCNVQRLQGFQEAFSACTTCTLKSIQFSIADLTTTLPAQITSAIEANPNVNYIAGTFDQVALDATTAVRNQGKASSIKVVGFDAPNLQLVKAGNIQVADIVTGQQDSGWEGVDAAARIYSGMKVPDDIPPSMVLVTQQNIAQIGAQFNGATGYEEQFKTLWGLG